MSAFSESVRIHAFAGMDMPRIPYRQNRRLGLRRRLLYCFAESSRKAGHLFYCVKSSGFFTEGMNARASRAVVPDLAAK